MKYFPERAIVMVAMVATFQKPNPQRGDMGAAGDTHFGFFLENTKEEKKKKTALGITRITHVTRQNQKSVFMRAPA